MAWHGEVGLAGLDKAWQQWHGSVWQGVAGRGMAARAWQGEARHGTARQQWQGWPRLGGARRGMARHYRFQHTNNGEHMSKNGTTTVQPESSPDSGTAVKLRRLSRITYSIPIRGTAPLIVNRWSEKAKEMMLAAQQSSARAKKEPKDPVACFEASRYRMPDDRDGFPATAFKASIVHAARLFEGVTQVQLKQTVTVIGEGPEQLVPLIVGPGAVTMREDTPRNASGVADLRYRAQFWPWEALIQVHSIEGMFDVESVFALVDAAGIGGVGEWRPTAPKSATGTFGTFEVL